MMGRLPRWDIVHPHWDRSEWEGDKLLSVMIERLVEEHFVEQGDHEMRRLDVSPFSDPPSARLPMHWTSDLSRSSL
jgi:hypothetical protein